MDKISAKNKKKAAKIDTILRIFFHTKKSLAPIDWNAVNSILIEDFTGIGDLVMLIPFLRVLRENAPNAIIDICCNSYGKPILENLGIIRNFYLYDGRLRINYLRTALRYIFQTMLFIRNINRKNTYDIAIEPRGDLRYIFFMHFIRAKRKVSYDYSGGSSLVTDMIKPSSKIKHLVDDKLYLLEAIGCKIDEEDRIPFLELSSEQVGKNKEFLRKNGAEDKLIIGIHPGASTDTKRWKNYPELVKNIGLLYGKDVFFLIFSAPSEESVATNVFKVIQNNNLDGTIIDQSFEDYIRTVAACHLIICNDSGIAHIAAAYGIPVIVIFGPTDPDTCAPRGKSTVHIISSYPMSCKPYCCVTMCKKGSMACMKSIKVEKILDTIKQEIHKIQSFRTTHGFQY